jgi:hypothetical protein
MKWKRSLKKCRNQKKLERDNHITLRFCLGTVPQRREGEAITKARRRVLCKLKTSNLNVGKFYPPLATPSPPWSNGCYPRILEITCGTPCKILAACNRSLSARCRRDTTVGPKLYSSICCWLICGIFNYAISISGTRGSAVGCGTMLQAGRSRVRVPMRSLDFFS